MTLRVGEECRNIHSDDQQHRDLEAEVRRLGAAVGLTTCTYVFRPVLLSSLPLV